MKNKFFSLFSLFLLATALLASCGKTPAQPKCDTRLEVLKNGQCVLNTATTESLCGSKYALCDPNAGPADPKHCMTKSQCDAQGTEDTLPVYSGEIVKCNVKCEMTQRTCNKTSDGYCPATCTFDTDPDCGSPTGDACTPSAPPQPSTCKLMSPNNLLNLCFSDKGPIPKLAARDWFPAEGYCSQLCSAADDKSCGGFTNGLACIPSSQSALLHIFTNMANQQNNLPQLPKEINGMCMSLCTPSIPCARAELTCNYDILQKIDPSKGTPNPNYGKFGACVAKDKDTCTGTCPDKTYQDSTQEPQSCQALSTTAGGSGKKHCLTGDPSNAAPIPAGGPCKFDKDCEGGYDAKCAAGICTRKCETFGIAQTGYCEAVGKGVLCSGLLGACMLECKTSADCAAIPNTTCTTLTTPDGDFNRCTMVECETSGAADDTKCSALPGTTCKQIGTKYLCQK